MNNLIFLISSLPVAGHEVFLTDDTDLAGNTKNDIIYQKRFSFKI